ncbi:MAG: DsrE family protein [Bacteroidetes bacterium]|nr:DsrE family protein [Bacteroidota bacterium]MBU1485158.1 DsrE family protein [Bacteroidota bacterium]MBU2045186.1 DsrE family protein [Bacteroidota bacterium]MBU2266599.1 DsrE family protein [Bacteroidota bacterium]MBU2376598.1 DsrE family protein [Bacteroidota bacterium]
MRKQLFALLILSFSFVFANGQTMMSESLRLKKDSALKVAIHKDSVKIEKEFTTAAKWDNLFSKLEYPLLKGGKFSGVLPVKKVTETPDPKIDYKILFEMVKDNPDSMKNEILSGLDEATRVINLHYAAGVPIKKIVPIIVAHGGAEFAFMNNEAYQKRYKMDNPNIKLINDLETLVGAKFIICEQAMLMKGIKPEEFLPSVKLSLTAQTVITSYQLKGYVLMNVDR